MQTSIGNTTGYVNYVYNLQAKGTAQVTSQIMGMSGLIGSTLGQLAFQTSAYLSDAESVAMSFGMVATAGLYKATKQAMEFDYAMQSVQAIAGQNNIGNLGEQAMAMSNKFGVAVDQMITGLESLARAGVSPSNMQGILEQAMGLSKLEAIDLNTAINDLISTTNLLDTQGLDLESPEYVEAVKYQNQKITATSEAAPINAQDIIHTLEHVGGYASSTNLDQDDLYAVIAQLGSKGTKSEIAGTSLRAFLAAGQKDTAQRALERIGLSVSDLWKNDEQILSISDMKDVLDEAMEAKGYTKQEKLEFYSDFAGYKQANQIMKIDTSSVREFKEKIDRSWDVGKKVNTVLQTTQAHLQSILQMGTNMLTTIGEPIMKVANVILVPLKMIMGAIDFVVSKVPGMKWVAAGTLMMVGLKGIATVFNKVAPSLGLMVLNFSDISNYAKNTRDALAESAKIIHTLSGGSGNRQAIVDLEQDRILSRIDNEDYLQYFVKYEQFQKKDFSKKQLDDMIKAKKDEKDPSELREIDQIIIRDKRKRFKETGQLYTEDKKSNTEIQEERNEILRHIIGPVQEFVRQQKQSKEDKRANSDGPDRIDNISKDVNIIKKTSADILDILSDGVSVKDFDTNQIKETINNAVTSLQKNVYTVRLAESNNVQFSPNTEVSFDFDYSVLDTINTSLKDGFKEVVEAINNCCLGRKNKTKSSKGRTSSSKTQSKKTTFSLKGEPEDVSDVIFDNEIEITYVPKSTNKKTLLRQRRESKGKNKKKIQDEIDKKVKEMKKLADQMEKEGYRVGKTLQEYWELRNEVFGDTSSYVTTGKQDEFGAYYSTLPKYIDKKVRKNFKKIVPTSNSNKLKKTASNIIIKVDSEKEVSNPFDNVVIVDLDTLENDIKNATKNVEQAINTDKIFNKKNNMQTVLPNIPNIKVNDIANLRASDRLKGLDSLAKWLDEVSINVAALKKEFKTEKEFLDFAAEQYYEAFSQINMYDMDTLLGSGLLNREDKVEVNHFKRNFVDMQDVIARSGKFNKKDARKMLKGGERFASVRVNGPEGAAEYITNYTVPKTNQNLGTINRSEYNANDYERRSDFYRNEKGYLVDENGNILNYETDENGRKIPVKDGPNRVRKPKDLSHKKMMNLSYSNTANSVGGFIYKNSSNDYETYNVIDIIPEQMIVEVAEEVGEEFYKLAQNLADKLTYLQQLGEKADLPIHADGTLKSIKEIEKEIDRVFNIIELKTLDMATIREKAKEEAEVKTNNINKLVKNLSPAFISFFTTGLQQEDEEGNQIPFTSFDFKNMNGDWETVHIRDKLTGNAANVRAGFTSMLKHDEFSSIALPKLMEFLSDNNVKNILDSAAKIDSLGLDGVQAVLSRFKDDSTMKNFVQGSDLLSTLYYMYISDGGDLLNQAMVYAAQTEQSPQEKTILQKRQETAQQIHSDIAREVSEQGLEYLSHDDTYSYWEDGAFTDTSYGEDAGPSTKDYRMNDDGDYGEGQGPMTKFYIDQVTGSIIEDLKAGPNQTKMNLHLLEAQYGASITNLLRKIAALDRQHKLITELQHLLETGQISSLGKLNFEDGVVDLSGVDNKQLNEILGLLINQPMKSQYVKPGTNEGKNQTFGSLGEEDTVRKSVQDAQAVRSSFNNEMPYMKSYKQIQYNDPNDDTDYTPNVVKKPSLRTVFQTSFQPDIVSASKATPGAGGKEEGYMVYYITTDEGIMSYIDKNDMRAEIQGGKVHPNKIQMADQSPIQRRITNDYLGKQALEYIKLGNKIENRINDRKRRREKLKEDFEKGIIEEVEYYETLDKIQEEENEDETNFFVKIREEQDKINEQIKSSTEFDFSIATDLAAAVELGVGKGEEIIPNLFVRTAGVFGEMHNGDPFIRGEKGEIKGILHDANSRFSEITTPELEKKRFSERLKSQNRLNAGFLAGNFGITQHDITQMKLNAHVSSAVQRQYDQQGFKGVDLKRYETDADYRREIDDMYNRMRIMNYSSSDDPNDLNRNLFTKMVDAATFEQLMANNMLLPQDIATHTENGVLKGGKNSKYEIFDLSLLGYSQEDLRNAAVMNLLSQDLMLQENTALMGDQEFKNLTLTDILHINNDGSISPSHKGSLFLFDIMTLAKDQGLDLKNFIYDNRERFMANMVNNPELLKTLQTESQIRKSEAMTNLLNLKDIIERKEEGDWTSSDEDELYEKRDQLLNVYETALSIEGELEETFNRIEDLAFIRNQYKDDPRFLQQLADDNMLKGLNKHHNFEGKISQYDNLEDYIYKQTLLNEEKISDETTAKNDENQKREKIRKEISDEIWQPLDRLFLSNNGNVLFGEKYFEDFSSIDEFKDFVLNKKMHRSRFKNEEDPEKTIEEFFADRKEQIEAYVFQMFKQENIDLFGENVLTNEDLNAIYQYAGLWVEEHDEWEQLYYIYQYLARQQKLYDEENIRFPNMDKIVRIDEKQRKVKELSKNLNAIQENKMLKYLGIESRDEIGTVKNEKKLDKVVKAINKNKEKQEAIKKRKAAIKVFTGLEGVNFITIDQILKHKNLSHTDKVSLIANQLSYATNAETQMKKMATTFKSLDHHDQRLVLNAFSTDEIVQDALFMAMRGDIKPKTDFDSSELYDNAQELSSVLGMIYAYAGFQEENVTKSYHTSDGKYGREGDLKLGYNDKKRGIFDDTKKKNSDLRIHYLSLLDQRKRMEYKGITDGLKDINEEIRLIEKLANMPSNQDRIPEDPAYKELQEKMVQISDFRKRFENLYNATYVASHNNKGNPVPGPKYVKEKIEKIEKNMGSSLFYGENQEKVDEIKKLLTYINNVSKIPEEERDELREKLEQYYSISRDDILNISNSKVSKEVQESILKDDLYMFQAPVLNSAMAQGKEYANKIIEQYFSTPWKVFMEEAANELRASDKGRLEREDNEAFVEEVSKLAQKNFIDNTLTGLSALQDIFPLLGQKPEELLMSIPKDNIAFDFSLLTQSEFKEAQSKYLLTNYDFYEEYLNQYRTLTEEEFEKLKKKYRHQGKRMTYKNYEEYLEDRKLNFKDIRENVKPIFTGKKLNKPMSDDEISNVINSHHIANEGLKNAKKQIADDLAEEITEETIDEIVSSHHTASKEYGSKPKTINEKVQQNVTETNKTRNQLTDWLNRYKNIFNKAFTDATSKVFGHFGEKGFEQSFLFKGLGYDLQAQKLNHASTSLQKNITFLTQWRESLLQVAGDSQLLQVPLDAIALGLTSIIMGLQTVSKVTDILSFFVSHAQQLQDNGSFYSQLLNSEITKDSGLGQIIGSIGGAIEPLGTKIDAFIAAYILPLAPYLAGLGVVIYGVKEALDASYKSYKKYLQQLQDEEKENKSRSKALKLSTEQSKKANDQYKYALNKQKLENANLSRISGAIKLTEANNDMLWGQYGIASALDKIQGKYESTATEYDGTSGQIRRIKEHTTGGQSFIRGLPGYYSQAEEMVAAYYDANKLAIGVMDEYKDELGELYDAETNAMKKNPEHPRETKEFQQALDKFVEATGITRDHAQQYLDYMQTEHNVDNAVQAMQAQADTIMARTDMQIQAIAFGGNPADVLGLNGIESQQNAMVQAQADMIKLETSSQLWWKAVWSTITSPVRALFAPIFSIAHILGAIWATITGNWNAAGMHMQQAGASLNVLGETATYWGAWGNVESTDFNAIGQGAINDTDRADYGNAATASGSGRSHVKEPRDNSIFGFLPVWWPNWPGKGGAHGAKEHQEQLAKNAQESFFSKLIGGITATLGTILSVVSIIAAGKGLKWLWNNTNILQKVVGKITNYLPGVKTGLEQFVKNHPKVGKAIGYAREGARILGLDKAKNFIAQYIPQSWKDTWAELWTKKEEDIKEEEVTKDTPIEENVGSIRENVANIWTWLKDLFNTPKEEKKKEEDIIKQLPGGNVPLLGPGPTQKEYNTYYDPYDEEIAKKIESGHISGLGPNSQTYALAELAKIKNQNLERYNNIIEDSKIIPTIDNMENQLERFLLHGNFQISQQAISDNAAGESLSTARRVILSPNYLKRFSSFDDNKVQSTIWHELVHTMLQHGERHQGKMQIDENDPVYKEGLNTPHVHRASELEAYLGSLLTQYKMAGYDVSARDLFDNFDTYENQENLPIHLQKQMAEMKGRITWFKNHRSDDIDNISFDMLDSLSDVFVENKDIIMSKLRSEAMLNPEFINLFNNSKEAGEFQPDMMNIVSINNKVAEMLSTFANGSKDDRRQYEALPTPMLIDSNWGQDKMISGLQAHYLFTHLGAFSNSLFSGDVNPWDIATVQKNRETNEEVPITYGDFTNYLSYAINHSAGLWENSILYHGGGPLREDENSNLGSIHKIMSTSFSYDMAKTFEKKHQDGVTVKMYAPMGTKGLYTNSMGEDEYTIDEGQRFITLSRDELNRPTEVLLLTQEFLDQLGVTEEALNQAVSQGFNLKELIAQNNFNTNANQKAINLVGDTSNTDNTSNTDIEEEVDAPTSWKQYFSDKTQSFKGSIISGIMDPKDKEAFTQKKRKGMTKEDRKYLNEKYNLGLDLDEFRTAKQANKAVRNKLDETRQWDTAIDDLYLKEKGGYRGILKENYLDPWAKYGKDKAKEKYDDLLTDAYAYRERPDMFEDVSTPVKWLAKGLDLKDKYLGSGFGSGLDIEKIQEALKDPEVMEELLKEQLDSIDSDSPLGQYRDKIYKAHEIATDPEKAITWAQNKYGQAIDMGSEEYEWYQGGEIDYKDLSWANQIRSIKENVLGMGSDESVLQVLQDPERTMEMANKLYGAYQNGDLEGTFNLDNLDVYQNIKEKMAGIFNKEDIEEAIEDGIDDGTDGGGNGGLFGSIKKLFGFGEEDTSPITKEEMEENEKKGEFETIPEWKERYFEELHKPSLMDRIKGKFGFGGEEEESEPQSLSDWKTETVANIQGEEKTSLSNRVKNKIKNIFGSDDEGTPMDNISKFMNMDVEAKHALMESGLSSHGIMGGTFMESTPGGMETSESILPLDEDDGILPEINGKNISKGGKVISKIGNKLAGKGGKLGKIGKIASKGGDLLGKFGTEGVGSLFGESGILSSVGSSIAGAGAEGGIMSSIAGMVGAEGGILAGVGGAAAEGGILAGVLGGGAAAGAGAAAAEGGALLAAEGGLAATGVGLPLAAALAAGTLILPHLGDIANGIGGAISGVGKALFGGGGHVGDEQGGGLLGGLMAASPIGMLAGAAGGLLGSVFGGGGPRNMGSMAMKGLGMVAAPLGGVVGMLGKMFTNDKETKSLNEKMEAHAGKTLDAVREQNSKTTPNSNVSGGNITIQNININTQDDPEAIKAMFLELIIELQEQVNPRMVSRTAGQTQNGSTQNTTTEQTDTPNTDANGNITSNRGH